jgi:hypothetical protein
LIDARVCRSFLLAARGVGLDPIGCDVDLMRKTKESPANG